MQACKLHNIHSGGNRMKQIRKLIAAAAAAVLWCSATVPALPTVQAVDYAAKKSRVSVHDPSIIKDPASGAYYVFGSHIDAAKTTDLQSWRVFTNGYATTDNKLFGNLSDNLKKPFAWAGEDLGDCEGGFSVWAPDVIWNPDYVNANGSKGAYLMYFCTSSDYRTSVIAYAASQNIEGPYTCVDTIVYSGFTDTSITWGNARKTVDRRYNNTNIQELIDAGEVTYNSQWFNSHNFNNQLFPNAIDPTIYYDTNGKMYMCYGSWSGGIFTLEIDKATGRAIRPKTGTTADGRMVDSYFGTKISGGYGKSGEGPFIEYNADTGFYYLFVTYGGLFSDGGYNMRVGRARDPLGPFVDAAGRNMVLESGTNLNTIGLKLMTNYKFSSLARAYMACGHNSVLRDDDGQWYLFNHARFDDGSEYHEVRVHAMNFNEAGWPVVMPYEYSGDEWSSAGYEPAQLAGDYEFINHGTATDGKITNAAKITLGADGSISGAVTGSWTESNDSAAASFRIGNVTYTGYFAAQYDESGTGKRVMTFTAAGSDNQTIWGVQTAAWSGSERSVLYNHVGSGQLVYDDAAVTDTDGGVYITGTALLSSVPYTIINVNSGLVLDVAEGKAADGTPIQQWGKGGNKSGDRHQDFRITDNGDGWCRLTSMIDERYCIAVKEPSAENGIDTELQLYTGADNQLWRLEKSGSYFGIVSKCSGGTAGLDVYEWSIENGGAIKQWELWGGECQLWQIVPTYASVPDHAYTLRNVNSGLFVGAAGSALQQGSEPQVWQLTQKDGWYTVSDAQGNAVTAADGKDGSALTLSPLTGSEAQQFAVWCNADGSYTLLSRLSDSKAGFDVYEVSTAPGAKVVQWSYHGGDGQKFVLAPAAMPEPDVPETTTTLTETTTTTTTTETTAAPAEALLGDTDCSGDVNVADAVLLARFLAEDSEVTVSVQGKRNADCNLDGDISADDNTMILEYLAGIRETL